MVFLLKLWQALCSVIMDLVKQKKAMCISRASVKLKDLRGCPKGNNNKMQKLITMYYDSYEKNNGDGFYPLIYNDQSCDCQIDILFELYENELTQLSGPQIKGYDGNTYSEIIKQFFNKN